MSCDGFHASERPRHSSGSHLPASYCGGPGLILDQSMWEFYVGQSDLYGIFSEHFGFLVSVMPPVIRTQPNLLATFTTQTIRQSPGTIKGVMFLMKAGNMVQKSTSSFFPSGFEEITAMFFFLLCLIFYGNFRNQLFNWAFSRVLLSSSMYINKLHDKGSVTPPTEYNTYFNFIHHEIHLRCHQLRRFFAKGVRII